MARFPPITRWLWWAYETGRLPKDTFDELLLGHHLEVCAPCREEYEAFARAYDYGEAFERTMEQAGLAQEQVQSERDGAVAVVEELLAKSQDERVQALRQDERFRTSAALDELLERSYGCFPGAPDQALHLATLVEAGCPRPPDSSLSQELLVRALTHRGNALRALGHLRDAESCFREARKNLEPTSKMHIVTDLSVYALLDWWEGVGYRERSEFDRAEELLDRAALLFAVIQDEDASTRVMLSLGALYHRMGNALDALDAVAKVLAQVTEETNPGLYWIARFNRSVYLTEAESYDEAKQELAACLAASRISKIDSSEPRVAWLRGRIAAGEGDCGAAERHLRATREAFLQEDSGINMALASLDLALVYLQTGETAKLLVIAEEMALIFEAGDVHREAAAALMLFQEAVRRAAVTARDLKRLRRYLEDTRHNPAIPFQRPS